MTSKELHESLVTLYLRLNGYFTAGFVVHSPLKGRVITEVDVLAVRFPHASEREREVGIAHELRSPIDRTDLLICEVKSTAKGPQFNKALRTDPYAIAAVLRRFGAFSDDRVPVLADELFRRLQPTDLAGRDDFPRVGIDGVQVRAVLFAVNRIARRPGQAPFISGKQLL